MASTNKPIVKSGANSTRPRTQLITAEKNNDGIFDGLEKSNTFVIDDKDEDYYNILDKSILSIFWISLKEGLPSGYSASDLFINSLILKFFMTSQDKVDLVAATNFFLSYLSILYVSFN